MLSLTPELGKRGRFSKASQFNQEAKRDNSRGCDGDSSTPG